MPAAAPDFRMFWDNAYAVHHLSEEETPALDILGLAEDAGTPIGRSCSPRPPRSRSPGRGSPSGGSAANIAWYLQHPSKRTIGPDKINHLRHVRFLQARSGSAN